MSYLPALNVTTLWLLHSHAGGTDGLMQTERREAYRVSVSGDDAVTADVTGERGRANGDVVDLNLKGATVLFPVAQAPYFAVGESVTVDLHSVKASLRLVQVRATVQARSELEDARRFGLSFSDPAVLRSGLSTRLLPLFNQRKAVRVEPSDSAPVDVRVCVEELEIVARLRDISSEGVGLLIDAESEAGLSRVVNVILKLQLHPDGRILTFRASIRNRTRQEAESAVHYGLRLEPSGTTGFSEQQTHVVNYVMDRKRDLLQSRVGQ